MTGPIRDWAYDVEPPDDGWIWVPDPEEDLAAWAQAACADLFVTGPAEVELADQLRSVARRLRERAPDTGALWIPDPVYGVLATLVTDRVRVAGTPEELVAEYRFAADPGLAPPQVAIVQLPAGPAVRVRRLETVANGLGAEQLIETVTHLVLPPGIVDVDDAPTAIELVVTWTLLQEGDEFAQMAAEAAGRLRIVPG
ncbi:hypothetical protein [Blastococcus saxobsidens]|uniref:Uncharacterized protein n=1 Tax=Blastococcus saxobsidens (strain DD2) TaxID=1146883 RepID=H6RUY0_BLASD|nr:hypothetical protein [Blastococcus saxobsidens]CCG04502.1 protein of unknown function [Blastococcus saxobsidens DD2]